MFKNILFAAIMFLFFSSAVIMPHGDEKHKGKVEKVSTMQMENMHSQMNMEGESVHSDSLRQVKENETQEKDFAQIRKDVENSTVPTVIKAISLAAFIAGMAFLYLPRKKKENSNV